MQKINVSEITSYYNIDLEIWLKVQICFIHFPLVLWPPIKNVLIESEYEGLYSFILPACKVSEFYQSLIFFLSLCFITCSYLFVCQTCLLWSIDGVAIMFAAHSAWHVPLHCFDTCQEVYVYHINPYPAGTTESDNPLPPV